MESEWPSTFANNRRDSNSHLVSGMPIFCGTMEIHQDINLEDSSKSKETISDTR